VINITTKNPSTKGLHSQGGISTGTFGSNTLLLNPFADLNYKFKNGFFISGMVDYSYVNGINATIDTSSDPSIFKSIDQDNWKRLSTGATIGYNNQQNQFKINYKYTQSETDIDRSAFKDDDNYILNYKRSTLSGAFSRVLKKNMKISLTGGVSGNERHAVNDSSIKSFNGEYDHTYTEDTYSGLNSNVDLILEKETKHIKFLGGIAGTREEMTTENYIYSAAFPGFVYENHDSLKDPKPKTVTSSIYLQMDMRGTIISKHLSKLNLVVGGRYDHHELFKEHYAFEINPSWQAGNKTLIYLSYSTGYNAPSLYQLYSNTKYTPWDGSTSIDITQGNITLKPENSASFELGIKYKLNTAGVLSLSAFNREVKNQIEYTYLWNGAIPINQLGSDFSRDDYRGDRYINAGSSKTIGFELSLRYRLMKNLSFAAGLSLIKGELDYTVSPNDNKVLNNTHVQLYNNGEFLASSTNKGGGLIRRPNTFRGELIYDVQDKFSVKAIVQFVGKRDDVFYDTQIQPQGALNTVSVAKYMLLDLKFTYNIVTHIALGAGLENILNQKYSEIRGFSTRGRGLYFKLSYQL